MGTMTTDPLTAAELAALEAEHTPAVVPPCPVCGSARVLIDNDALEYRCAVARSGGGDYAHQVQSRWYQPRTDPRILRLVAEVRAHRGETP